MIDIDIDTSRAEAKIAAFKKAVNRGIGDGAIEAQKTMQEYIDFEMFVPLKFEDSLRQSSRAVVARSRVTIQRRERDRRREFHQRRRPIKQRSVSGRKRWWHYAREFASAARLSVMESLRDTIRRNV